MYLGFGAGLSVFMFTGFVKSIPLEIRGSGHDRRLQSAADIFPHCDADHETDMYYSDDPAGHVDLE